MIEVSRFVKKTGWFDIIINIIIGLIGLLIIVYPQASQNILISILGGSIIIFGLLKISFYIAAKGRFSFYNYDFVFGVIAIIIGVLVIVFSAQVGAFFRLAIALWIIYSALVRLVLAAKMKNANIKSWIAVTIIAILILSLGFFILIKAGSIMSIIGVAIVASSILDIVETLLFMNGCKKTKVV